MKPLHTLLIPLAFMPIANGQTWSYLIDQEHNKGGGQARIEVDSVGTMTSELAVPLDGSEFTIWAREDRGDQAPIMHYIGSDTVGAYLPASTITITTPDPYEGGIPRTRVDKGFTVYYEVSGLLPSDPEAPLAAKQVLFNHRVEDSTIINNVLTPLSGDPRLVEQEMLITNHELTEDYEDSLLGEDLFTEAGTETFKMYALPDGEIAKFEIASAQVQVWPLASGGWTGFDTSQTYRSFPTVSFTLENLYPKSETYLQFYKGKQEYGKLGTRILDLQLLLDQGIPSSGVLELDSIEKYFDSAGVWTVEVITTTVFGNESITSQELNFATDLEIRGGLHSIN